MARSACNSCGGKYSVLKTVHLDEETMRLKACLACNNHFRTFEISEKRFEMLRQFERGHLTSLPPAAKSEPPKNEWMASLDDLAADILSNVTK